MKLRVFVVGLGLAFLMAAPLFSTTAIASATVPVATIAIATDAGCVNCMTSGGAAFCSQLSCTSGSTTCSPYNYYLCLLGGACSCCEGEGCGGGGPPIIITLDGSGIDRGAGVEITEDEDLWGLTTLKKNCAGVIVARYYDSEQTTLIQEQTQTIRI